MPDSGNSAAVLAAVFVDILIVAGLYVWTAASLQALFRKAGEQGWKGWVPVLNTITILQLGGYSGWWLLLVLVPVAGPIAVYVLYVMAAHRINRAFGFGGGMTVLAALLAPVWSSVLGWGSARWIGAEPVAAPGPVRTPASDSAPALAWAPPPAGGADAATVSMPADGPGHSDGPGSSDGPGPSDDSVPPGAPIVSVPVNGSAHDSVPSAPAPPSEPQATVAPPASAPAAAAVPPPISAGPRAALGLPTLSEDDELEGIDDLDQMFLGRGPFNGTAPASTSGAPQTGAASAPVAASRRAARAEEAASRGAGEGGFDTTQGASDLTDAPAAPRAASAPRPAEAPISQVPLAAAAPPSDPWAPPASEQPLRTPRRSPMPEPNEPFSETSAEVSAVIGAPRLGSPMAARSSVSALRNMPELPDPDSVFDETVVAPRRRPVWTLTPPAGSPIALHSTVLIVGRRPAADPAFPGAQLVDLVDETRTMSKTHARLELHDDLWTIVDLHSTNGVVLLDDDGGEVELSPGVARLATRRILLGDAEVRLGSDGA